MKNVFCILALSFVVSITANGQEAAPAVSDEELTKYATAMDSVSELTTQLMDTISVMVKGSEAVSAARYNDLSKIINDETKLAEAKATPEEIAFVKEVAERKNAGTAQINATFQSLAKDYVGAATFNKVKKALAADPELKTKYDSLMTELKKDNSPVD
jgi:hypothetical protein